MIKRFIFAFIFLLFISDVFAATIISKGGGFKLTYPDKVNVFEPVKLHFEVVDKNLINNTSFIFGDFTIPLTEGEGFEHKSDLSPDGVKKYNYDGKNSFDIYISLLENSQLDLNNKKDYIEKKDDLETNRSIYLCNDQNRILDEIKILFKVNKYDFDVKNVPEGFINKKKDLNNLIVMYVKKGDEMSNHLAISISSYNYNFHNEQKLLSKNEIMNEIQVPDGYDIERFTVSGNPAYLTTSCKMSGWKDEENYHGNCVFTGRIYTAIGILFFDMVRSDKLKSKTTIENEIETWKSHARENIHNIIMDGGKSSKINIVAEKEDNGECETDSDCSDNNVCNACGKCVKKAINPELVNTEIKINNKLSSKSIYNSIRERVMITTKIIPTFMYNGKKINYCDIAAPGIKKELVAEMKNSNSYAGFLLRGDLLNENRTKSEKIIIDFSEKALEYHFLISPDYKKKEVGKLGDVIENIEIRVEGSTITNEKLILKPVDLSMDIKSAGVQLQEDSNKLIKIVPKDKYAKHIFFKASVIGPGSIMLGKSTFKQVYAEARPGKTIKLMYFSPKMGNFDIGKELASLSMTNLQIDAGKQVAEDAVLTYAGDVFQGMEDLHKAENVAKKSEAGISAIRGFLSRNPTKYNPTKVAEYVKKISSASKDSKKLDLVAKSYKLYSGIYGLSQIPKGTVSLRDDMKNVLSTKTVAERKTWTESISEWGVVGIDVAQTGVSMLTFLPNKIPVFGKMTSGAKIAFSAMTNIWKANLLYLAKDEKIARAEEHLYPIMILMTAEDESGWQITKGYMLQVAYNEI